MIHLQVVKHMKVTNTKTRVRRIRRDPEMSEADSSEALASVMPIIIDSKYGPLILALICFFLILGGG